jgi:hypothetical protein
MRINQKSMLIKNMSVIALIALISFDGAVANAATKTITCYKASTVKKVTATSPQCPSGYTTTKPFDN